MRYLLLLLVLLLASPCFADAPADAPTAEVRDLLARWARSMRGVKTLRVEFAQEKTLRVLRRPRKSEGVALLVGSRVKLTTRRRGRVETEMAVDDASVRIHYPALKRLEVYPRRAGKSGMPFPVFGGDVEALPDDHAVTLDDGALVLRPRDRAAAYTEVRMTLVDDGDGGLRVGTMTQVGTRGDKVQMTITRWVRNPELKAEAVALEVPAGTEVVKLTGD